MAQFLNKSNVPVSASVTGKRDIITSPSLFRWVAEGKVFEAGQGCESTAVDSGVVSATLDETLPTFSLQSPSSGVYVVPLVLKLMMVADGGALTNWQVAFTKAAAACVTALSITGTAIHHKSNVNKAYNTSPASTCLYTPTVTALTVADYISLGKGEAIDAALTTGLPTLGIGASNTLMYNFINDNALHIMANGSAMLAYLYTASSASTWYCYMQWAELTADDLY
jgi:hypothetical protein